MTTDNCGKCKKPQFRCPVCNEAGCVEYFSSTVATCSNAMFKMYDLEKIDHSSSEPEWEKIKSLHCNTCNKMIVLSR